MPITNEKNFPAPIVRFLEDWEARASSAESKLEYDIRQSQLIDSPRIRKLLALHKHEITQDASDMLWALQGSMVHQILEGIGRMMPEEALVETAFVHPFDVDGKEVKIKCRIDLFELAPGRLSDWKYCSPWQGVDFKEGGKKEWIYQLNVNAWMLQFARYTIQDGTEDLIERSPFSGVKETQIVALYRSWEPGRASKSPNYPRAEMEIHNVPLWEPRQTETFIKDRIRLHLADGLPRCSQDEMWMRPDVHAVMKKGRKNAVKLFEGEEEMLQWLPTQKDRGELFHVKRPGEAVRCFGGARGKPYCPVWQWCDQRAEMLQEKGSENE